MASTYKDAWVLANPLKADGVTANTTADAKFRQRVEMAIADNARRIRKNDVAPLSGQERLYLKRQALASAVIANPKAYTDQFAYQLAVVGSIVGDDTTTDNNIRQAVDDAWNAVAGVFAGEGAVA